MLAVATVQELVAAVRDRAAGATIEVAAGTFELDVPLDLKTGMTLKGAGIDKTVLTHTPARRPSTATLPDPEMKLDGLDTDAYLIRIQRDSAGVAISDLTLYGPQLHGAIFAWFPAYLHLHRLRIKDTLWSGVRTFGMKRAEIHDCEFIDAGGRWSKGQPGVKGGITGGGIFACWMPDCTIRDNIITCEGQARPLLRAAESYAATIENNTLTNVSDSDRLSNSKADGTIGLEAPLKFACGVNGEFLVDGWNVRPRSADASRARTEGCNPY